MRISAVLGVDVGGTRIKSVLLTQEGTVVDEIVIRTPQDVGHSLGSIIQGLRGSHESRCSQRAIEAKCIAVGVVVPGVVNDESGIGVYSANLGWRNLPIRALVSEQVRLPVAVSHDVRAGLVAESRFGAATDATNVLFVPIGTGIASAAMVGSSLVTDPQAGEVGHVMVSPLGDVCGCGARGCLETVASARAIGRRFEQATHTDWDHRGSAEVARLVAASRDANRGIRGARDPNSIVAVRIWDEAVEALGSVLAPVVAALGTERLLIGGGLVRAGSTILDPLSREIHRRVGLARTRTVAAELGDRAGALGSAALAWDVVAA